MRSILRHTAFIFLFLLTAAAVSFSQTDPGTEGGSLLPPIPGIQHEFRAGPWWIGNGAQYIESDGGLEKVHGSAVSPLKTSPGYALIWNYTPSVSFLFGLDLIFQEYVELPSGSPFPGKAVPADKHTGSDSRDDYTEPGELQNVASVVILPLQIAVDFPLIRRAAFRSGPGIGVIILNRIPLLIEGESTDGLISAFWGGGSFLLPELNWGFAFSHLETTEYGFRVRSMWPLSSMISPAHEGTAWWDGLNLQMQFFFRPIHR